MGPYERMAALVLRALTPHKRAVTVSLPTFCTAAELSRDLKDCHGLDFSPERLAELASMGNMPHSYCDGVGPLFQSDKAKRWIKKHLVVEGEARPFPAQLAVYDARTWKGRADIPPELALAQAEIREIPVAPFRWSPGIYFLVKRGRVVYVGQSVSVLPRLVSHFHGKEKEFDRILFIQVPSEHLNKVEAAFIRHIDPEYNRTPISAEESPSHLSLAEWFGENRDGEIARIEAHFQENYEAREKRRLARSGGAIERAG